MFPVLRTPRRALAGTAAVGLLALVLLPTPAEARTRDGFFIGLGLGALEGNFDIDGADEGDLGATFELHLGHAWPGGFALGGGLSNTRYAYEVQLFGEPVADLEFSFTTLDGSAWYFLPVSDGFEFTFRLGVSSTLATARLGDIESDDESAGFHAGLGADFFVGDDFAIQAELLHRSYGVAFAFNNDEEVSATGLVLGVRWR